MSLQQIIPVILALATAFVFRKKLSGSQSRWRFYPVAFAVAVSIAATIGIVQFWMPQVSMGLGAKGLPLIVFAIVAARAALPTVICTVVLLAGMALAELWRRRRSGPLS